MVTVQPNCSEGVDETGSVDGDSSYDPGFKLPKSADNLQGRRHLPYPSSKKTFFGNDIITVFHSAYELEERKLALNFTITDIEIKVLLKKAK